MKNEKINWFGEGKNKSRIKISSNSINFLGTGQPQKNSKKSISQNINFFGLKTKKSKNYKMTPSPLFRKESIRTNKRKLSKWGDADLDGSPNYFDCDPRNAFKDATPVGGERVKGEKKEPFKERLKKYIREKTPRKGKGGYSPLKEEKEA